MKVEIYEKLFIADTEFLSKRMEESFLMCGKNWNWYFMEVDKEDIETEELKNIKFIEFKDKNELNIFLNGNDFIDYSIDFEKPCAIAYA